MKKILTLICCVQLGVAGCAARLGRGSADHLRGERLAIERGKLSELTNPVARTKSYIVIAGILLSFAVDAARDQDHDDFRRLLIEYSRTIRSAQEAIVNSERPASRHAEGYSDLETAMGQHVRTLQDLRPKINAEDQNSLDEAIQLASSIREEMSKVLSRAD